MCDNHLIKKQYKLYVFKYIFILQRIFKIFNVFIQAVFQLYFLSYMFCNF